MAGDMALVLREASMLDKTLREGWYIHDEAATDDSLDLVQCDVRFNDVLRFSAVPATKLQTSLD